MLINDGTTHNIFSTSRQQTSHVEVPNSRGVEVQRLIVIQSKLFLRFEDRRVICILNLNDPSTKQKRIKLHSEPYFFASYNNNRLCATYRTTDHFTVFDLDGKHIFESHFPINESPCGFAVSSDAEWIAVHYLQKEIVFYHGFLSNQSSHKNVTLPIGSVVLLSAACCLTFERHYFL